MNKKENDQLKKIDQLDKQLDNTINKIGVTKVEPIKISKKKLALFMLIPFSLACVLTAVTSFLVIDPFHWYTKSRLSLEQKQEKEIKRIKQEFADLSLATALDSSSTIADLLWEVKFHPNINDIVQSPNEIITITSKKSDESKLSTNGEEVNIKILVRTGSLEKEIEVTLLVIIENERVRQVSRLIKSKIFLDKINVEIKADGVKRAFDLADAIKTVINEDDLFKTVFKDMKFDIVNDKNDDEIIASGLKTLNLNFGFKENNKLISSSVKLNVNLQGKSRKEINQDLADKFKAYPINFWNYSNSNGVYFIAQNTFANKSTYKDLIDELLLFDPTNNFYLLKDAFKAFDNIDSKISFDFTIEGKSNEDLNEKIIINNGKGWERIKLKSHVFVGNGQDKSTSRIDYFFIMIMKEDYAYKDLFLYISKARETMFHSLIKYEPKTKIGSIYRELDKELEKEVDKLTNTIVTPNNMYNSWIKYQPLRDLQVQNENDIISVENLKYGLYYAIKIYFHFNNAQVSDSPVIDAILLYIPVKK